MMVKDKNRPKHPMSAYACFVQVIREEHRKKHPNENVIFSEFSKKCAEKWKQMSNEQRRCFEEMAKLDLDRFNREMAHYVPPAGMRRGRRRRRTKDPAMPKRSWSAFFFFCDAFRSKIRNEHPDWKVSDIAKELGRRWEECTDKEKYERHAQNDKLRYEQDMQKYKAGIYVATKRARVEEDEDIEPSCVTEGLGNSDSHRQANDTTDGPAHVVAEEEEPEEDEEEEDEEEEEDGEDEEEEDDGGEEDEEHVSTVGDTQRLSNAKPAILPRAAPDELVHEN
ncbi:High mobility group-T protein [Clonorchis sinensis]|uniref:High mobility group-T protein n=1 Tax=Clonorchis sinensis TaxID=79923 RepID=A0A8T1MU10_CLOSI|nr:High mobility group-T protein [Clonorchis sinensis]